MSPNFNLLLALGDRLKEAQLHEQRAAETHRCLQSQVSREAWFRSVQLVDELTDAYVDLTLRSVGTTQPSRRLTSLQPIPLA